MPAAVAVFFLAIATVAPTVSADRHMGLGSTSHRLAPLQLFSFLDEEEPKKVNPNIVNDSFHPWLVSAAQTLPHCLFDWTTRGDDIWIGLLTLKLRLSLKMAILLYLNHRFRSSSRQRAVVSTMWIPQETWQSGRCLTQTDDVGRAIHG
jgi:hypothetical protein